MTANLQHLTEIRGGVFTRGEALDDGETDRTLAEAVRSGLLVRLRRGMYVSARIYGAADVAGQHLLHARAALHAQKGPVALAGISAAALYGFALHDIDLTAVDLLRLDEGSARYRAGAHHRVVLPTRLGAVVCVDGILAVQPARAVWEVACRTTLEGAVVTADSALHSSPRLGEELAAVREQFAYVPGSRGARRAIGLADGRAESPGESVTRVQFYRYGLPCPTLQYRVETAIGRLAGIADFGWPDHHHLGEFDGRVKYEALLRPGEAAADAVIREKRREDLMRSSGYGMTRFTWADVMPDRAGRTMMELRLSLERSHRLYVRRPAS